MPPLPEGIAAPLLPAYWPGTRASSMIMTRSGRISSESAVRHQGLGITFPSSLPFRFVFCPLHSFCVSSVGELMRSAPVLGSGGYLINSGLQQIKIVLNSKTFANALVVNTEIAEMKCSISFSKEGIRE